jgi:acyl-CoA synthetase (AMP-forming)/AMP-acid ligase II
MEKICHVMGKHKVSGIATRVAVTLYINHYRHIIGDLLVRGPWITKSYYREGKLNVCPQGWFQTGDVARLDPDGYMQITDRSKDVIKSGGEWISSIDLENEAVGHPKVLEAAVIAVPHPKWEERPLLIVVPKPGQTITRSEMLDYLTPKVAKWWLPEDVVTHNQPALPKTGTGKIQKLTLRAQYKDHKLPVSIQSRL